jgi:hypothetical protein
VFLLDLRGTLSFKLYISISQVTLHCHHLVVTSPQNTLNKYSDQGPQQSVSSQYSQGFEQNQTFQYQSNDYCARDNYNSENDGHRDRGRDKNDSYQEKPTYEQSSRTRISRWEHNRNEDSHRAYRSRSPDKARGRAASRDRRERSPITTNDYHRRGDSSERFNRSRWNRNEYPQRPPTDNYRQPSNHTQTYPSEKSNWIKKQELKKQLLTNTFNNTVAKVRKATSSRNAPGNTAEVTSKKQAKFEAKLLERKRLMKLIYKDYSARCEAAAKLRRNMINKYKYPENMTKINETKVDKAVRGAVVMRIDLILRDNLNIDPENIIELYYKSYPISGEKAFFDAIIENVQREILIREQQRNEEAKKGNS